MSGGSKSGSTFQDWRRGVIDSRAAAEADRMEQMQPQLRDQYENPTPLPPMSGGDPAYGLPGQYQYQSPTSDRYYVDPNRTGKKAAQETRAELARAEFDDYKERYLPIERQAIREMTTEYDTITGQEMERTKRSIGNTYDAAGGMADRRMSRYGLSPAKDGFGNSRVSTLVGGLNSTQRNAEDRRMAFIGGGMNTIAEQKNPDEEG